MVTRGLLTVVGCLVGRHLHAGAALGVLHLQLLLSANKKTGPECDTENLLVGRERGLLPSQAAEPGRPRLVPHSVSQSFELLSIGDLDSCHTD